jgi:hypothetical protein
MPALWGDSKARWGSLWHTWAGDEIPRQRSKLLSVLTTSGGVSTNQSVAPVRCAVFAPYDFATLTAPAAPITWGDATATWASLQFTWDGRELIPPHSPRSARVFSDLRSISVFTKPATF